MFGLTSVKIAESVEVVFSGENVFPGTLLLLAGLAVGCLPKKTGHVVSEIAVMCESIP